MLSFIAQRKAFTIALYIVLKVHYVIYLKKRKKSPREEQKEYPTHNPLTKSLKTEVIVPTFVES